MKLLFTYKLFSLFFTFSLLFNFYFITLRLWTKKCFAICHNRLELRSIFVSFAYIISLQYLSSHLRYPFNSLTFGFNLDIVIDSKKINGNYWSNEFVYQILNEGKVYFDIWTWIDVAKENQILNDITGFFKWFIFLIVPLLMLINVSRSDLK